MPGTGGCMASISRWSFVALVLGTFPAFAASNMGLDAPDFDAAIRPQDDLYRYVNDKWLKRTEIPADNAAWSTFNDLQEKTRAQLRGMLEAAAAYTASTNPNERKLGELYKSFMDEEKVDQLGAKPIAGELARIEALTTYPALAALFAHLSRMGVDVPVTITVSQDHKDSSKYAVEVSQSGLGLP